MIRYAHREQPKRRDDTIIPGRDGIAILAPHQAPAFFSDYAAQRIGAATGRPTVVRYHPRPGKGQTWEEAVPRNARDVIIQTLPFTAIQELVARRATTRFTVVNHGSVSSLRPTGQQRHFEMIELSRIGPNLRYAQVDPRIPIEHDRMFHWPNPVREIVPEPPAHVPRPELWRIAIGGRPDILKNHGTTAAALRLLANDFRLAACYQPHDAFGAPSSMARYLEAAGIRVIPERPRPWADYGKFLATRPYDVGLHLSLAESYNLTALEHLAAGIPCLGSSQIRYLPTEWTVADPADPAAIADMLRRRLASLNHTYDAHKAWKAAQVEIDRTNALFTSVLTDQFPL